MLPTFVTLIVKQRYKETKQHFELYCSSHGNMDQHCGKLSQRFKICSEQLGVLRSTVYWD